MAGNAALGTTIKIGAVNPVTEVVSFDGPSASADTFDISNMASSARTFVVGLVDSGEVTVELNYDPGVHDAIADLVGGTVQACTITFADTEATVLTFDAFVTGFSPSGERDGILTATVTLKVDGAVDWDDAA